MCKVPVHSKHSIKFNKLKSLGFYYVSKTSLQMNYGDYKTHEMAYNLKELPTFGDRLKHAQMKQLERKLTDFYQSIKFCYKDSKSNDQKGE